MPQPTAYLLVFHGSRDPRPQLSANVLAQLFEHRIQHGEFDRRRREVTVGNPPLRSSASNWLSQLAVSSPLSEERSVPVKTACLECGPVPLHQQIEQFGRALQTSTGNCTYRLLLLPLFLLAGVHVMEDIPAEVALAQQALGEGVVIEVCSHLGAHPGLARLITERIAKLPIEAWILLSHGSSKAGANEAIEALAERLGGITAYWATAPNLETRLQELIQLGFRRLAILPFFLFAGKTTDAISQTVQQLSQQFPALDLQLASPLEASPEIADLLVDLATTAGVSHRTLGLDSEPLA